MTQLAHPTLARTLVPRSSLVRDAALVLGGAALVALVAQVEIPLRPVPVTLQTLAVLLVGAALGWKRGFAALAVYLVAGAAGLPVFSGGTGTLLNAEGALRPSLGFLLSYPFAAALVGGLVQRYALDRQPAGAALAMLAASGVIYAFGLTGLGLLTGLRGEALLTAGLTPFLVGDALKIGLAALLLPGAWALVRRR
ncbi:biotin transporter BioY [Deinococcus sp. SDU3-2]|uniref:Biotin transporter n=1 Tax=Deinococcus terrestris TaxID=2651870 RepID=A0A7X1NXX0_9DEIO|nr:biotin transporter BioY [Deinococcus terrestris]MPY67534.1 biotin transporter BioY [Deinococcus terrestris]